METMFIDAIAKHMLDVGYTQIFPDKKYFTLLVNTKTMRLMAEELERKQGVLYFKGDYVPKRIRRFNKVIGINGVPLTIIITDTNTPILYVSNYKEWDNTLGRNAKVEFEKVQGYNVITIVDKIKL